MAPARGEPLVPAPDYERLEAFSNAGQWLVSWHPSSVPPPPGIPHGSAGVCVTPEGDVVLVSQDGEHWDLPGGRPEGDETMEETLRRELLEEACADVRVARLLGFSRGECVAGPERGRVIVRSLWRADVELLAWEPHFETLHRRMVTAADVVSWLGANDGIGRVVSRALLEAGLFGAP